MNASAQVLVYLFVARYGLSAWEPADLTRPRVVAPRFDSPPPVAARVDAGQWRRAARLFGFVDYRSGRPAKFETVVHLGHDGRALFFAFRCHAPVGMKTVAEEAERDSAVYRGDCIEIYLVPRAIEGKGSYYQFLVSPRNVQCDLLGADLAWNGKWQSAAKALEDGWLAVVRIPFQTLGLTSAPPAAQVRICARGRGPGERVNRVPVVGPADAFQRRSTGRRAPLGLQLARRGVEQAERVPIRRRCARSPGIRAAG